jgi:toxin ParE1/3/4
MPSILITPAAENDLVNIWLYIARDNQDAADRVYQAAEKTFESLLVEPRMRTLYQTKRAQLEGMRFFPVSKFQN